MPVPCDGHWAPSVTVPSSQATHGSGAENGWKPARALSRAYLHPSGVLGSLCHSRVCPRNPDWISNCSCCLAVGALITHNSKHPDGRGLVGGSAFHPGNRQGDPFMVLRGHSHFFSFFITKQEEVLEKLLGCRDSVNPPG